MDAPSEHEPTDSSIPQIGTRRLLLPGILLALNLGLLIAVGALFFRHRTKVVSVDPTGLKLPLVVAMVGGRPITRAELLSATALAEDEKASAAVLKETLQNLIAAEVVAQKADAGSRRVAPAEVDFWLQAMRNQFESEAGWGEALGRARLRESELRGKIQREIAALAWLDEQSVATPEDVDLHAWFEANADAFRLPEAVLARHFVSIFPSDGNPVETLETGTRFRDAARLRKQGLPFQQLVDTLSDDPAKKTTGGSLSWFQRSRMEPPLVEAAFRLDPGVISPPVQTRFGFHLLEVQERRPARALSFSEALPELRLRVSDLERRKKIAAIVAESLKRANIVVFADALR